MPCEPALNRLLKKARMFARRMLQCAWRYRNLRNCVRWGTLCAHRRRGRASMTKMVAGTVARDNRRAWTHAAKAIYLISRHATPEIPERLPQRATGQGAPTHCPATARALSRRTISSQARRPVGPRAVSVLRRSEE
ncbi:hypothetical protein BURKHO8Y_110139 [Burkholderia sp. 8Y]|nr:hypothetical protein BURKHO8Y_110139 [Burkholderia sp. 8Y]